jgi:hypothetical protein
MRRQSARGAAAARSSAYSCTVVARLASILLAALALAAVAPSAALAGSGNAAATRTYIQANYTLVRVARTHLAAAKAAIASLVGQITGQCPLAAARSPQGYDSEQLSNEVVGAMMIVAYRPDAAAMDAFAHTVGGLRWSNRTLTHTVRTYATQFEGFTTLALPDVCADVEAWAASGYRTLSPATVQFDKLYGAADFEAEEVPLRLLAPYESAREASLLHRTKRLEAPLAEAEANAAEDYSQILNSLKLSP